MSESNNLTRKEFWSTGWRNTKLPAIYFNDYPHKIVYALLEKYVSKRYKNFLEIGGCPGRWASFFSSKFGLICDSMDYTDENIEIIRKNYKAIGIQGRVFFGDITEHDSALKEKYDIVFSDGLVEHFVDSREVFRNHVEYLNKGGLLIISVPNIKKSKFYDFFSRFDRESYDGYRDVSRDELTQLALENNLEVLYCGFSGVFNLGLVNMNGQSFVVRKLFVLVAMIVSSIVSILRIRKESSSFSPYIYLIAKKHE